MIFLLIKKYKQKLNTIVNFSLILLPHLDIFTSNFNMKKTIKKKYQILMIELHFKTNEHLDHIDHMSVILMHNIWKLPILENLDYNLDISLNIIVLLPWIHQAKSFYKHYYRLLFRFFWLWLIQTLGQYYFINKISMQLNELIKGLE